MSGAINYPFSPIPAEFKLKMRQELKGNLYKLCDAAAELICQFPEGRESFTKEISCRMLEDITKIRFDHVARGLRELESKGFLRILKSGSEKSRGSIIQLLVPNNGTQNKKSLPDSGTNTSGLLPKIGTIKEYLIQETIQQPENTGVVVPVKLKKIAENAGEKTYPLPSSLTEIPGINTDDANEHSAKAERLKNTVSIKPPVRYTIHGIPGKTVSKGLKILKQRGIIEVEKALKAIEAVIKYKSNTIMNKKGYFISLCQEMEDFNINHSAAYREQVSSIQSIPAVPERKIISPQKTKAYLQAIEKESNNGINYEKEIEGIMQKDYDNMQKIIREVDRKNSYISLPEIKSCLYYNEYMKKYL